MEFKTDYYEEIFASFLQQSPFKEEDVDTYRPKHIHAIRVTLRNGDQVDYSIRTKSYRPVPQLVIATPDDITDDICREVFAANLQEAMVTRGIGQAVLAERTGLSSACISKYLHKKSTPSITQLEKIAHALGCDRYELLD